MVARANGAASAWSDDPSSVSAPSGERSQQAAPNRAMALVNVREDRAAAVAVPAMPVSHGAGIGQDDGQRDLALFDVVTDRLAGRRLVDRAVEHVIGDLERPPERAPIPAERSVERGPERAADARAPGEQRRDQSLNPG